VAKLKDKVQLSLDEARMLVLGAQVLLGFQTRAVFEKGYEALPVHARYLKLGGLGLMLLAIALLMTPAAFHRIVEAGEDTHDLHRFSSRVMTYALWPFALTLGIDFFVVLEKLSGLAAGVLAGLAAATVAVFFWWGLELLRRARREPEIMKEKEMSRREDEEPQAGDEEEKIKDKIMHVLTEARTVLPGAQALLGFQFAAILMEGFDKLPASSKYVHICGLSLIALSVILLMTPAAYHRIVEQGEETKHFHRFAGRILIAAMIPLALGINCSFFVVARKATDSVEFSLAASALGLLLFYGLWFGLTLYRRAQHTHADAAAAARKSTARMKAV
jgi:hypothetical protein